MEYKQLGRTGLRVSPLCLGTMNFGPETTEADSFAIMDRALEQGINFFDTANVMAVGKPGEGVTEQIIGRWLAQGGKRREQASCWPPKCTATWANGLTWARLSAYHIRQACEDSLRRLQTDHIDLYQMHHVDRDTPWEEIWQAMEQLVREGKVIYVGSSNFAGWHIAHGAGSCAAAAFHGAGVRAEPVQPERAHDRDWKCPGLQGKRPRHHSLESRWAAACWAARCKRRPQDAEPSEGVQKNVEKHRAKLEAFEGFCRELGEAPADVALAWLLHNPVVTAPIIGPRTQEQLDGSLRALEIKLGPEQLEQLDTIFPGPGGEAPEAYAW